ncbi:hypothetical protein BST81_06930 [Leptolyngbya sp. 'hensonii']|uniref:helix-turn-helix domain-containing protein n=1 Tax=Leptolyngbya sp. 'hensonii' TaxID=1922337 RepID=UPI00094FFDA5|nr:RodZ domain-containing protein [Leptolyngbya sp. 'hensonii']OLP18965.1 hypothetical protein BST81_06930 [Leptolyngbya sp. 'hensonii']
MSQLDPTQLEQLKELGDYLRQQREEKNLRLEEVKAKTYIPLGILEALENAQVEHLPEPVFIQGFIKRYAELLGLDGVALARSFPVTPQSPISTTLVPLEDRSSPLEYKPVYTSYIVGAILIGLVVFFFPTLQSTLSSLNQVTQKLPARQTQPSATPDSARELPVASPVATAPIQVTLILTGESWLKVMADDKTQYEGVLSKGTQRTWSAQRKLTIETGNAGAVSVALNAGETKVMGAPGEVKRVTFKAGQTP